MILKSAEKPINNHKNNGNNDFGDKFFLCTSNMDHTLSPRKDTLYQFLMIFLLNLMCQNS